MLQKNVLVPVAHGIEEVEAVTIIDVLRRSGVSVRISGVDQREITGANGIKLIADSDFLDEIVDNYDAIVLPGGTDGAKRFASCKELCAALKNFYSNNNLIAAICASPALVFAHIGVLDDKKATCYPAFKDHINNYVNEKVVVDGAVVTSQGPGTAMVFSLTLAEILVGKDAATKVKDGMLV